MTEKIRRNYPDIAPASEKAPQATEPVHRLPQGRGLGARRGGHMEGTAAPDTTAHTPWSGGPAARAAAAPTR